MATKTVQGYNVKFIIANLCNEEYAERLAEGLNNFYGDCFDVGKYSAPCDEYYVYSYDNFSSYRTPDDHLKTFLIGFMAGIHKVNGSIMLRWEID